MFQLFQIADAFYRVVMLIGSYLCHQLPERSPHIAGVQMPLCWRCTGITLGVVLFFCWLIIRKQQPPLIVSCALASLMVIDVLTAMLGLWSGNNTIRFFTGLLWGVFAMNVVLYLLQHINDGAINLSSLNFIGNKNGR